MKTYEYYVERFLTGVSESIHHDYKDMAAIRRENKALDRCSKIASDIGKKYPDRIEEFSRLMSNEDPEVRLCCAVCVVELMPHTDEQLKRARSVMQERLLTCNNVEKFMINKWPEKHQATDKAEDGSES